MPPPPPGGQFHLVVAKAFDGLSFAAANRGLEWENEKGPIDAVNLKSQIDVARSLLTDVIPKLRNQLQKDLAGCEPAQRQVLDHYVERLTAITSTVKSEILGPLEQFSNSIGGNVYKRTDQLVVEFWDKIARAYRSQTASADATAAELRRMPP